MALDWQSESVMRAADFYSVRAGYPLRSVPAGSQMVVASNSRLRRSVLWMGVFEDRCLVSTKAELVENVQTVIQTMRSCPDLMQQNVCSRLLDLCSRCCKESLRTYRGAKLVCSAEDYISFPQPSVRGVTKADLSSLMRAFYPDIAADDPDYEAHILGGGAAYACFVDGGPVSLAHTHHPGYMCNCIGDLSVEGTLESYRGRGYGRAVVAAATGEVIRQGRTPVWGMFDDNVAAKRTAASVGFRPLFRLFEVRYRQ